MAVPSDEVLRKCVARPLFAEDLLRDRETYPYRGKVKSISFSRDGVRAEVSEDFLRDAEEFEPGRWRVAESLVVSEKVRDALLAGLEKKREEVFYMPYTETKETLYVVLSIDDSGSIYPVFASQDMAKAYNIRKALDEKSQTEAFFTEEISNKEHPGAYENMVELAKKSLEVMEDYED